MINIFLLWFSIYLGYCFGSDFVRLSYGDIKGKTTKYADKTVYEFLGVPYAKPAVGKRRFTPPLPFESEDWYDQPYNATYPRNGCYQNTKNFSLPGLKWTHPSSIAEDCHHVNIWRPNSHNGGVLVVFFDILHMRGSGTLKELNGGFLAAKTGLIVVTVSYRLSIFGFGYLNREGREYLTGNTGLLDQQMSLRWVYENIEKFGGNRKTITIAGFGSASKLVTAHLFSTKSHKYFSRIFASSETITSMWSYNSRKVAEKATLEVAYEVGCKNNSDYDIYHCLLKANPYKLAVAAEKLMFRGNFPFQYGFNVINYDSVFFNGNLVTKIKERNMKEDFIFFGSKSKNIGALFLAMFIDGSDFGFKIKDSVSNTSYSSFKVSYSQFKTFTKVINKHLGLKEYELKKIYEKYFKVSKAKKIKDFRSIVVKMISDIYFNVGMEKFVYDITYHTLCKKAYFYEFSRISSGDRLLFPEWVLPMPGSEVEYFFGNPFTLSYKYNKKYVKLDQKASYKMMMLMKEFVTTGKPGKKWYGVKRSTSKIVVVGDNEFCKEKPKKTSKTSFYSYKIKRLIQFLPNEFKLQI